MSASSGAVSSENATAVKVRPPMLSVLPWTLAGVLLLTAGFVLLDWQAAGTVESLELRLIRWTRVDDQPELIAGPPMVQEIARDLTALGGYAVLVLVSVLFAGFLLAEVGAGEFGFFSGLVWSGYFLVMLMKRSFLRMRPEIVPHLSLARGATSFPSAHAMMSLIVYAAIGLLLSARVRSRRLQRLFTVFPLLLSGVVGVTRVCMGVHYPTDVLAGWAAGLLWTWVWFALRARLQQRPLAADVAVVNAAEGETE
jgi:undecaprenyl-diphosphatase